MSDQAIPTSTECPVCGGEVGVPIDVMLGEILICPDCGTELEVTNLKNFTVDEAPMELEDFGE